MPGEAEGEGVVLPLRPLRNGHSMATGFEFKSSDDIPRFISVMLYRMVVSGSGTESNDARRQPRAEEAEKKT
jgi:hypothetical protein